MAKKFVRYSYSIITKEGLCVPNVVDTDMPIDTDKEKEEARRRWKYLVECGFTANRKYEIIDSDTRRVIQAVYSPHGKVYTFEVDFKVRIHQSVIVDDLDVPGREVFVTAESEDHEETVEDIEKKFPIQRLRKARQYK